MYGVVCKWCLVVRWLEIFVFVLGVYTNIRRREKNAHLILSVVIQL